MSISEFRLPGAVRPQEPEHLAVTDLERDVLEGHSVDEALGQGGQRSGRAACVPAWGRAPV